MSSEVKTNSHYRFCENCQTTTKSRKATACWNCKQPFSGNEAKNAAIPSTETAAKRGLGSEDAATQFAVGDPVAFANERGTRTLSVITRIVPRGEYSATEIAYAIRGTYGDYVRVAKDLERVTL